MHAKYPGGDLAAITLYMVIAGLVLAVSFFRDGSAGLGALLVLAAVLSVLVWFDQKWVALPLIALLALLVSAAGVILVAKGFSWRLLLRIAGGAYAIQAYWAWWRSRDAM